MTRKPPNEPDARHDNQFAAGALACLAAVLLAHGWTPAQCASVLEMLALLWKLAQP